MTMSDRALNWLTVRGLDVELADRLGLRSEKRGLGEALVIPTFRKGREVAWKYRLFDGTKKDPGRPWETEGETCFWNEDVLWDTSLDAQPLVICEGQWDALAAIQCGFLRTVSVPNGAPPPIKEGGERDPSEMDRFRFLVDMLPRLDKDRFKEIILAVDGDPPGAQLLQDLSVILGRWRCKYVSYASTSLDPDPDDATKDTNGVLQRDGVAGVQGVFRRARWLSLPGVYLMSDLPPAPPDTIYDIGSESRGLRLIGESYRMRLGDIAVGTGVPGFGKSTLLNDLCCRVADHYGVRICWASFEQNPKTDHRRSLVAWYRNADADDAFRTEDQADAWIDRHHVFIRPNEDEDCTLDWLLTALEGAVVRYGARIVVIDPWNEIEHRRDRYESETDYIGWALRTFKRFARKFNVHMIIIAHPTKSQKVNGVYLMPTLYDINGSSNWYNKCDVGFIIHRTADDTIMKVQKVKYHDVIGRPGEISLSYNGTTRRYTENERIA